MVSNLILIIFILASFLLNALGNVKELHFLQYVSLVLHALAIIALLLMQASLQQMLLFMSASVLGNFVSLAVINKLSESFGKNKEDDK